MAQGFVAFVPVVVTILVLRFAFLATTGILLPFIDPAVADWPWLWRALLSLGVLLVVIYLLGEIAARTVGRRILGYGEAILLRVPFVKVVYRASKQVVEAFQRPSARAFKSVVFLEFPRHPDGFAETVEPEVGIDDDRRRRSGHVFDGANHARALQGRIENIIGADHRAGMRGRSARAFGMPASLDNHHGFHACRDAQATHKTTRIIHAFYV